MGRSLLPGGVLSGAGQAEPLARLVPVVDAARYERRFPPSSAEADAVWITAVGTGRALRRQAARRARRSQGDGLAERMPRFGGGWLTVEGKRHRVE